MGERAQGRAAGRERIRSSAALGVAALLLVGCYRGDFLAAACDRQGTCVEVETGSSSGGEGSTGDGTSTGDAPAIDAYRMTSITIVDPHFYYMLVACEDATPIFNSALAGEVADGTVNIMLVLDPADPDLETSSMRITEGACVLGATETTCGYKESGLFVPTIVTNSLVSTCDVVLTDTVNPAYAATGAPNLPAPPCFTSQRGAVILPSLAPELPPIILYDAQIAATYGAADPPVDGLISGVLTGFVPESQAVQFTGAIEGITFNLWGSIAGGGGCTKDPMAPIDDTDPSPDPRSSERGVQMYLNFVAERVEWIE